MFDVHCEVWERKFQFLAMVLVFRFVELRKFNQVETLLTDHEGDFDLDFREDGQVLFRENEAPQ